MAKDKSWFRSHALVFYDIEKVKITVDKACALAFMQFREYKKDFLKSKHLQRKTNYLLDSWFFFLAEKEGIEPSRRFPGLLP